MLVTEGFFGEEGAAWQAPDRLSRTLGDQTRPRGGVVGPGVPECCPEAPGVVAGPYQGF